MQDKEFPFKSNLHEAFIVEENSSVKKTLKKSTLSKLHYSNASFIKAFFKDQKSHLSQENSIFDLDVVEEYPFPNELGLLEVFLKMDLYKDRLFKRMLEKVGLFLYDFQISDFASLSQANQVKQQDDYIDKICTMT